MKPDVLIYNKKQLRPECANHNYWLEFANLYWRTKEETESAIIQCKESIRLGVGHPVVMRAKLKAMEQHLKNLSNDKNNRPSNR